MIKKNLPSLILPLIIRHYSLFLYNAYIYLKLDFVQVDTDTYQSEAYSNLTIDQTIRRISVLFVVDILICSRYSYTLNKFYYYIDVS